MIVETTAVEASASLVAVKAIATTAAAAIATASTIIKGDQVYTSIMK